MRRVVALVVIALVGVAAPACSREKDKKDELREIIDRTERLARAFVYLDQAEVRTEVRGLVEDDFRYKARLTVAGVPVEEEVIADDALAARFLTPDALPRYLAADAASAPATVIAALRSRRWVLDEAGAPAAGRTATDRRQPGEDAIYDAVTSLQAVTEAIDRSRGVQKYSPDDIDPVYKPAEDPFPKGGSGVTRYDLRPPRLPNADAGGASAQSSIPDVTHFRKMVVYVRDGQVIEVREDIDVRSKLEDLSDIFNLPKGTTATEAIFAINQVRKGLGTDLVRVRKMTLQLSRLGEPLKADLPADVIKGSLRVLRYRGAAAPAQQT